MSGYGPSEPLDGCSLKLRRIEYQLDELKGVIDSFERTRPYTIRRKDKAQSGEIVFRLEEVIEPPLNVPLIAGEILHNLRSTLDYLICALVQRETGKPASRQVEFPICENVAEFVRAEGGKILGLSSASTAFLEQLQPYNGPNGLYRHPLWYLSVLNNMDKHRMLAVAATCAWSGKLAGDLAGIDFAMASHIGIPELKPGTKIVTLKIRDGTDVTHMNVDVELSMNVAFSRDCGIYATLHVFQLLLAIRSYIYQHVFVKPGLVDGFDFDSRTRYRVQPYTEHLPPMP